MRVAAGQFSAGQDPRGNLALITEQMETAAASGAELLLLPEWSIYGSDEPAGRLGSVAEGLDGPFISGVCVHARKLGLPVVVGTLEHNPGGLPYNTVVAVNADGGIAGTYRKIHLYDAFGYSESEGISPGGFTDPFLLEFGDLRIGIFTCYDLRFPESARYLVDAGANVLLVPAMWVPGPGKEDHWNTLVRARAIKNTAYVVTANQTGPFGTGFSIIVDPAGVVLANAGEMPAVILADISLERLQLVRGRVPSLLNRRFKVIPRLDPKA
jgi:predicted amidohydrolase